MVYGPLTSVPRNGSPSERCPCGGIGRRSGFKIRRREACRFESGHGYQQRRHQCGVPLTKRFVPPGHFDTRPLTDLARSGCAAGNKAFSQCHGFATFQHLHWKQWIGVYRSAMAAKHQALKMFERVPRPPALHCVTRTVAGSETDTGNIRSETTPRLRQLAQKWPALTGREFQRLPA